MFHYAEINIDQLCIGVKSVSSKIEDQFNVPVETPDSDYLNRKYIDGQWSTEKFVEDIPSLKLSEFEEVKRKQELMQKAIDDLIMSGGF